MLYFHNWWYLSDWGEVIRISPVRHQWLRPIIQITQEAEIRRITV
jgi:hypothetical protein